MASKEWLAIPHSGRSSPVKKAEHWTGLDLPGLWADAEAELWAHVLVVMGRVCWDVSAWAGVGARLPCPCALPLGRFAFERCVIVSSLCYDL